MTTAPVRMFRKNRFLVDPDRRRKARPLTPSERTEKKFLKILKITDITQMVAFWLTFLVTGIVYAFATPTETIFYTSLTLVTVVVLAMEAWMVVRTRRGFLRARGFLLFGVYGWVLGKPLVSGIEENIFKMKVSFEAHFLALVIMLLFCACVWTGYVLRGSKRGFVAHTLDSIIPRMTPEWAFWFCVACFVPEMIHRWALTDWSRVQSVVLALLGQEGAAKFFRGRFGDSRAFWLPAEYLYELFSIVAVLAFLKCKGRIELQAIILSMYLFNIVSLALGWSRYKLATALFTPIMFLILVYPIKKHWRLYVLAAMFFAAYVPISNLMVAGRNGLWFRKGVTKVESNTSSVFEDNFTPLANVIQTVPTVERYKPFYDMYYFVAIMPIPRVLWKSKPYVSQEYLGKIRPHYCAVCLAGDAYICGGVWHVIVAGLGLGVIARSLDNFSRPWRPMEPEVAVVHLACAWVCLILTRSIFAAVPFGFPVIALLTLLFIVRYVRGRRGATSRTRSRRRPARGRSLQDALPGALGRGVDGVSAGAPRPQGA